MIDGRRGRSSTEDAGEAAEVLGEAVMAPADPSSESCDPGPSRPESDSHDLTARRWYSRSEIGRRVAEWGVTADQITVIGVILAAVTCVLVAVGYLWAGVGLITVGGLMDTLDGAVARAASSTSPRGAFFDSVSDRVSDALIFGGVAYYLAGRGTPEMALLPVAILAVGNVISYERAKAESLGWNGKGGLMERAERLIVLAVALAFNVVLVPILWALLALCVLTALQRFVKVWRQATAELYGEPVAPATSASAALAAWRPARVESRWRAWREARASGASLRAGTYLRDRPRSGTRVRSRRHAGEPLSTRLRSVLAYERAGLPAREKTALRSARLSRRRQEGAAAAFRRRLGSGR